jgi:hypothetical protein
MPAICISPAAFTSQVIDFRSLAKPSFRPRLNIHTKESIMAISQLIAPFGTPSTFLRKALLTDAVLSGVTGLALALASVPLAGLLSLPAGLLRWSAVILIPFAAFVAVVGTRHRVRPPLVFVIIAVNILWAADSVLLLFTGWVEPTLLGKIFVGGQAVIVAVLAEFEFLGLRYHFRFQ